jgi:hypothetical protein
MKIRSRYLSAIAVNFVVPWVAYRLTLPHYGPAFALAASMVPLVAWIAWDLARFHHFDALTALVLVGTTLSLVTMLLTDESRKRLVEEPLVSGIIGLCLLLSLTWRRPMVFYLARSTMARESSDGAAAFEKSWSTRPDLPGHIRLMTLVWGLGTTCENLLRGYLDWSWPDQQWALVASRVIAYGFYAGLTAWTVWYRSARIKKNAAGRGNTGILG